jgi:hypothetical protein
MTTPKLVAYCLCLIGLAGFLFSCFFAVAYFLVPPPSPTPDPLADFSPGCLSVMIFATMAPLTSLPGIFGLGLWIFQVRKADAAKAAEMAALPHLEEAFQSHLDGIARSLLDPSEEALPRGWAWGLSEAQHYRLSLFLAECRIPPRPEVSPLPGPLRREAPKVRTWDTRPLAWSLLALGVASLLWFAVAVPGLFLLMNNQQEVLASPDVPVWMRALLHQAIVQPGLKPGEVVIQSLGCFVPGLVALLGALGLRWLMRREGRTRRSHEEFRAHARQLAQEACCRQLERLLPLSGKREIAGFIARAFLVSTLAELDGPGKGSLLAWLHGDRLLARLAVRRADFSGAVVEGLDLAGAALAGVDLSGARMAGASLRRADLRESSLRGADLRRVSAEGVDLRGADLQAAQLQHGDLRLADLSGADLTGAELWQTDLAGAQLAGAWISPGQLPHSQLSSLDGQEERP